MNQNWGLNIFVLSILIKVFHLFLLWIYVEIHRTIIYHFVSPPLPVDNTTDKCVILELIVTCSQGCQVIDDSAYCMWVYYIHEQLHTYDTLRRYDTLQMWHITHCTCNTLHTWHSTHVTNYTLHTWHSTHVTYYTHDIP